MSQIIPVSQTPVYYYGPAQPKKKNHMFTFLIGIFLIIITFAIQPYLNFKPWFDWFDQNDPQKQYRCLPLTAISYYYGSWSIFYSIAKLFTPEYKLTEDWQIDFLMGLMKGQAIGIAPGGFLTPKMLCETLVPDNWPFPAGYIQNSWPQLQGEWKNFMTTFWGVSFVNGNYSVDTTKWEDPSNFLWQQWKFPGDSPLILGFITGRTDPQTFPQAILPLLGIDNGSGKGLYGFTKQGGSWQFQINDILRFLWSDYVPSWVVSATSNPTSGSCNPASVASGSIGMGLGFAFAAAEAGPFGILGGLFGAILGGVLSASSSGCFN